MPSRVQQNSIPLRKISDFKSKLTGGGARPNLFEVELAFEAAKVQTLSHPVIQEAIAKTVTTSVNRSVVQSE